MQDLELTWEVESRKEHPSGKPKDENTSWSRQRLRLWLIETVHTTCQGKEACLFCAGERETEKSYLSKVLVTTMFATLSDITDHQCPPLAWFKHGVQPTAVPGSVGILYRPTGIPYLVHLGCLSSINTISKKTGTFTKKHTQEHGEMVFQRKQQPIASDANGVT